VAPADLPFGFSAFAHLLGVVLEDVLASAAVERPIRNDPGADVQGDDQLNMIIAEGNVVRPAFEGDVLDLHLGKENTEA